MPANFFYVEKDSSNLQPVFLNLDNVTRAVWNPEEGYLNVFFVSGEQSVLVYGDAAKTLIKELQQRNPTGVEKARVDSGSHDAAES